MLPRYHDRRNEQLVAAMNMDQKIKMLSIYKLNDRKFLSWELGYRTAAP